MEAKLDENEEGILTIGNKSYNVYLADEDEQTMYNPLTNETQVAHKFVLVEIKKIPNRDIHITA